MIVNLKEKLFGNNAVAKEVDRPLSLISDILPTIYIISGFILFLYMVFGGFLIMSGGSDSKKTEEGKQALTNAIIGFGLIFASYWIIQIIEIITGIAILTP